MAEEEKVEHGATRTGTNVYDFYYRCIKFTLMREKKVIMYKKNTKNGPYSELTVIKARIK